MSTIHSERVYSTLVAALLFGCGSLCWGAQVERSETSDQADPGGLFASSLCALADRDGDQVDEVLIADCCCIGDETVVGWIVSGKTRKLLGRLRVDNFCMQTRDAYRAVGDFDGDGIGEIAAIGFRDVNRNGDGRYCVTVFNGSDLRSIKRRVLPRIDGALPILVEHCTVAGRGAVAEVLIAATYQRESAVETLVYSVGCTDKDIAFAEVPLLRCKGQPPLTLWQDEGGRICGVMGESREHGLPPTACQMIGAPKLRFGNLEKGPLFGVHYVPSAKAEAGSVDSVLLAMKATEINGVLKLYWLDPDTLAVRRSIELFSSSGSLTHMSGMHGPGSEAEGVIALGGEIDDLAVLSASDHWEATTVPRGQGLHALLEGYGWSAVCLRNPATDGERTIVVGACVPHPNPEVPNAAIWMEDGSSVTLGIVRRLDLISQ